MCLLGASFLLLPAQFRLQAFLPGGAAIYLVLSAYWVAMLYPRNPVFNQLIQPLPSRQQVREEIEKIPDMQMRLEKYLQMTLEFKKVWLRRDQFFSGFNSALLLLMTFVTFVASLNIAFYEFFVTGNLEKMLIEIQKSLPQTQSEAPNFQRFMVRWGPTMLFLSSFVSVFVLSAFLRMLGRIRFGLQSFAGTISLFRLPDSWIWALIACSGIYLLDMKLELHPVAGLLGFHGMLILIFLYTLQGMGVAALFLEARLLPGNWIALFVLVLGIWLPVVWLAAFVFLTGLGLLEVWFYFRKRSLLPVSKV